MQRWFELSVYAKVNFSTMIDVEGIVTQSYEMKMCRNCICVFHFARESLYLVSPLIDVLTAAEWGFDFDNHQTVFEMHLHIRLNPGAAIGTIQARPKMQAFEFTK